MNWFVRQDLGINLGDLRDTLAQREDNGEVVRVEGRQIAFHLADTDPHISLNGRDVPATEHALTAFGDLLQFPQSALKRFNKSVQASTMDTLLNDLTRNTVQKDAKVTLVGNHLHKIDEWGKADPIKPVQIVDTAIAVLDREAPVARLIDEPSFFGIDVYAPEGFAHGYGGNGVAPYTDGNERDDITAGGLRFGLNMKQGLAPYVEEWLYRLACTNGMEVRNVGLKVDARGSTVEEVIAELEEMAKIAFGKVEQDIAHFYELKEQKVDNVERALRVLAKERGIPDRSTMALMELAVGDMVPDDPSMFDVVNLVTNYANSPAMSGRDGGRLILEGAGGSVVSDHAARCGHCNQKVH